MKYHYQHVSAKSVRIELIAEDRKETQQLERFDIGNIDDPQLQKLYQLALQPYATGSSVTKIKFMDFPKVALISFEKASVSQQSLV